MHFENKEKEKYFKRCNKKKINKTQKKSILERKLNLISFTLYYVYTIIMLPSSEVTMSDTSCSWDFGKPSLIAALAFRSFVRDDSVPEFSAPEIFFMMKNRTNFESI